MGFFPPPGAGQAAAAAVLNDPRQLARVVDYLLVTPSGSDEATPAGWNGTIDLGHGIEIRHLDAASSSRLSNACRLQGEHWNPPSHGVIHAYVREAWSFGSPAPEELYRWDDDN